MIQPREIIAPEKARRNRDNVNKIKKAGDGKPAYLPRTDPSDPPMEHEDWLPTTLLIPIAW